MNLNKNILFIFLAILLAVLILVDLAWGSIQISFADIFATIRGSQTDKIIYEILVNYRLPKAITAILVGAALSVAGLLMQTLFRNPLADPYILGVSSGASLGVAIVVMASSALPFVVQNAWSLIIAAVIGAALVLILVVAVSFKVRDAVSLLIVGIMFGTISSAFVTVLQNFSNPDTMKIFITWTFGSLSAVTWQYMAVLFPTVLIGTAMAFALQKRLDGFLLGENYARALGIPIQQTRFLIVIVTGLLAGSITAFAGPIAFVGIAIPHIARGLFRTSSHRILLPACILLGASLLLICDVVTQIPTHTLPLNTVSALFGAPIVIWILVGKKAP